MSLKPRWFNAVIRLFRSFLSNALPTARSSSHDSKYYITASPDAPPRDNSELTGQGGAEPVEPAGAHD